MAKDPVLLNRKFLKFVEKFWTQNNHSLKDIPCVYLIAAYDLFRVKAAEIAYVGSTTKLNARYKSHKVPMKVQCLGLINILYFRPMQKGFYDYEIKLIQKLKPIFNKQHKR